MNEGDLQPHSSCYFSDIMLCICSTSGGILKVLEDFLEHHFSRLPSHHWTGITRSVAPYNNFHSNLPILIPMHSKKHSHVDSNTFDCILTYKRRGGDSVILKIEIAHLIYRWLISVGIRAGIVQKCPTSSGVPHDPPARPCRCAHRDRVYMCKRRVYVCICERL